MCYLEGIKSGLETFLFRFNAQDLGQESFDYAVQLKVNDQIFVKLILVKDKLRGAVLIGETELEEV